jgi:hypothetical protein
VHRSFRTLQAALGRTSHLVRCWERSGLIPPAPFILPGGHNTKRRQAALARIALHDRVRIGDRVKPQYLRGETGTIHEIDGDVVVVYLDRAVGKFTSRHTSCSPEMLEVIPGT